MIIEDYSHFDICASLSGVHLIIRSDDMLNGMCISMSPDDARKYADALERMADLSEYAQAHKEDDEREEAIAQKEAQS